MKLVLFGNTFQTKKSIHIQKLLNVLHSLNVELYVDASFYQFVKQELNIAFTPTGIFEGIPRVDYNIWYWEVQDISWHEWTSGNFGPEEGFPLTDTTSKFKIQFINAGTYDLTVQIVTVSDNGVVCETSAVVDVPAENSLGYHVLDALDYVYVDGGEYNADAYSYVAEFDADADSIIAT